MSEGLVKSSKTAKSNKVSEARKEIEKLKTELESLISSNILKKNALLEQSNTNLIINNSEMNNEQVLKKSVTITSQLKKSVPIIKKAVLSPTKLLHSPSKKTPIENVEEPPKIIKTKHYDPKSTREYIKKQKLQRKTKEDEERIKKRELEDLNRQKMQELRQKTLELRKKSSSCNKKYSAKLSSDLKVAQSVNSAQIVSVVRKNPPTSRRVRPRSFDREPTSNLSNKSKTQPNLAAGGQRRARSLSRDSKLSDRQSKSDSIKTPASNPEQNLENPSKKEDIVESMQRVSKLLENTLDSNNRNNAATLIQATFKGYKQRKIYRSIRPNPKTITSPNKPTDPPKTLSEPSESEKSRIFDILKDHINITSRNSLGNSDNCIRKPPSFRKTYPETVVKFENDPLNFISTVRRNLEGSVNNSFKIRDPEPKIDIVDVSTQQPSIRDKINVSVQCDMDLKARQVRSPSLEYDFDTFKSHKIRQTSKPILTHPNDILNSKSNQSAIDEPDFVKTSPIHIKRRRDLILNDPTSRTLFPSDPSKSDPKIHIKGNRDVILNDPTESDLNIHLKRNLNQNVATEPDIKMHVKRNRDLILNDPTEPDLKIHIKRTVNQNVPNDLDQKIHVQRNRDLILNDPIDLDPKKSPIHIRNRHKFVIDTDPQKLLLHKRNLSGSTLSKSNKSLVHSKKHRDQNLTDPSDADTTKNIPEITEEETPISRKSLSDPIQYTDHLKNITFSRRGNGEMESFFDLEKPLTKLDSHKKERQKLDVQSQKNAMVLMRSDLRLQNSDKNNRKSISDSSITNSERSRSESNRSHSISERFNNRETLGSSISSIMEESDYSSNRENGNSKYPADINSILEHYSKKSTSNQYSDDFILSSQPRKLSSHSTNSKSQSSSSKNSKNQTGSSKNSNSQSGSSKHSKKQSVQMSNEIKMTSNVQKNNESVKTYSPKSLSEHSLDLKSETMNSLPTSNIVNEMMNGNHSFDLNATTEHKAEVHLLNSFNRSLEQVIAVEKSLNEIQDKENSFTIVDNSLFDKSVIDGRYSTVNYKRGCDIPNVTLNKTDKSIVSPRNFMFDQMIRDEDDRLEHLKAILKYRNKALFDRIKGELTWLEIQKKESRESGQLNHVTMIKKKQRGLLIKLEQERHEMIRLKQSHKQAAEERKHALRQQKSLIKHQLSSNEQIPAKIKRLSRTESRQSGPLKVYHKNAQADQFSDSTMSSSQLGDTSRFEPKIPKSFNSSRSTSPTHNESLKQALLMKEEALEKRRKNVEEILEWHNRLKAEEVRVAELELKAKAIQQHQKQLEKRKHLTGSQLNRIWNSISGSPRKRFDDTETYPMCSITNTIKVLLRIAEDEYTSGKSTEDSYTSDFDKGNTSLDELHTKFSLANSSTNSLDSKVTEQELIKIVEVSDQTMKTGKMSDLPEDIKQFSESNKTSILSEILSQEPTISSENKSVQVASVSSSEILKKSNLKKPEMIIEKFETPITDVIISENRTPSRSTETKHFDKIPESKVFNKIQPETTEFENPPNSESDISSETSYINDIGNLPKKVQTTETITSELKMPEISTDELIIEVPETGRSSEIKTDYRSSILETEKYSQDILSETNKTDIKSEILISNATSSQILETVNTEDILENIPETSPSSKTIKSDSSELQKTSGKSNTDLEKEVSEKIGSQTERSYVTATVKSEVNTGIQNEISRKSELEPEIESVKSEDKRSSDIPESLQNSVNTLVEISIRSETENSNNARKTGTQTGEVIPENYLDKSQLETSRTIKSETEISNNSKTLKSEPRTEEQEVPESSSVKSQVTDSATIKSVTEKLQLTSSFISETKTDVQNSSPENAQFTTKSDTILNTTKTFNTVTDISHETESVKSDITTEDNITVAETLDKSGTSGELHLTESEKSELTSDEIETPDSTSPEQISGVEIIIHESVKTEINSVNDSFESDHSSVDIKSELNVEIPESAKTEINIQEFVSKTENDESVSESKTNVQDTISNSVKTEIKSEDESQLSEVPDSEILKSEKTETTKSVPTSDKLTTKPEITDTSSAKDFEDYVSSKISGKSTKPETTEASSAKSIEDYVSKISETSTTKLEITEASSTKDFEDYVSSKMSEISTKLEITEASSAKDFESDVSSKTEKSELQADIPDSARTESQSDYLKNSLSAISHQSSENLVPESARSSSEAKTESEICKSEELCSDKIAGDSSNEVTEVSKSQKDDIVSEIIVSPRSNLNNRDRLVKPYISEAEELLRKQLEIEQEIKKLEREAIPYLFMREIPNKPPPPYKPPVFPLTPTIKSVVPVQETEIVKYVAQAADRLFPTVNIGKPDFQCLNTSGKITAQRFIFDLCRELVSAILKPNESEVKVVPSWKKPTKSQLNLKVRNVPLTKRRLEDELKRKVLHVLDIKPAPRVDSVIAKWSRKKRDHVDNILVSEAQAEEAQWVNYDRDEQTIKDKLTDEIMDKLILEAFYDFSEILKK